MVLIISDETKCHCELNNGGFGKNGILCSGNNEFKNVSTCNENEWCTGPSNEKSAVVGTVGLCEKGQNNTWST